MTKAFDFTVTETKTYLNGESWAKRKVVDMNSDLGKVLGMPGVRGLTIRYRVQSGDDTHNRSQLMELSYDV